VSVPLSEDDRANSQFAIGVELAARDLYQAAIDAGASGTAWGIFVTQHAQYAQRIAGLTGISASTADNTVYQARVADFQGTRPANAAYDLENTLVATHATLLGQITSPNVAGVLASLVVGGVGLIGDIIVGIVGAFIGGWIFSKLGVSTPFGGLAGTIFVAFVGAVVLLFLLHQLRGRRL
jgi:uncharacterized membrane protein YeaQ/YmgE (transglycosylase-associated protein family)